MATRDKQKELEELLGDDPTQGVKLPDFADIPGDPEFEFDLSDTGEIEDGIYPAYVLDFYQGVAKTSNNPQFVWKFQLFGMDRALDYYTSLAPNARWKVADTLRGIGVAGQNDKSVAKFKRSDVLSKPCRVEIKNEPYQGRMVPKIQNVLPPDDNTLRMAAVPGG